jgi:hypothetical protein
MTGTLSKWIERRIQMPQPTPRTTKDIGKVREKRANMSFLNALACVNHGDIVTSESWGNEDFHIRMNKGQMVVKLEDGLYHPMIVSQEDFDRDDWYVVGPAAPIAPTIPMKLANPVEPIATADDPRDQPGKDE